MRPTRTREQQTPYVCVSGVATDEDVLVLHDEILRRPLVTSSRRAMGAVLVTSATLRGEPKLRNPGRYAPIEDIGALLNAMRASGICPALHLCSSEEALADDLVRLCETMAEQRAQPAALQINALRVRFEDAELARSLWPLTELILQVKPSAGATEYAWAMAPFVDHILLDASRGEGIPVALREVVDLLAAPEWPRPPAGPRTGLAGGLGVSPLWLLTNLRIALSREGWDELSFDAEAGLRGAPDAHGVDRLDEARVRLYLAAVGQASR